MTTEDQVTLIMIVHDVLQKIDSLESLEEVKKAVAIREMLLKRGEG